jgi:hypothetical protein
MHPAIVPPAVLLWPAVPLRLLRQLPAPCLPAPAGATSTYSGNVSISAGFKAFGPYAAVKSVGGLRAEQHLSADTHHNTAGDLDRVRTAGPGDTGI